MSASIIAALVISGSRKADGTANASGKVWAYLPDTSTSTPLYADPEATTVVTQPIVLNEGGLIPSGTAPDGIFTSKPIRLYIEDAAGVVVSDSLFTPATAATVSVDNAAFSGETMDAVLTAAKTSFGGNDWKYQIQIGQVERKYKDVVTELAVSVNSFGAVGDGVTTDTAAIQRAIDFVENAGGGTIFLPSPNYKIDGTLVVEDTNGVKFVGKGSAATRLTLTHATSNVITATNCDSIGFEGIQIAHATGTTGAAISLSECDHPIFSDVVIGSTGTFRFGVNMSDCIGPEFYSPQIIADPVDAAGRGIRATTCTGVRSYGGTVQALSGYALEFDGNTEMESYGTAITPTVRWAATSSGTYFTFIGGSGTFGGISLDVGRATFPRVQLVNNGTERSETSSAIGGTQTPVLIGVKEATLTATASGGAGAITVNAPAILPSAVAPAGDGLYWDFVFKNSAGFDVTWTTAAIYVLVGGVAVPGTNGTTVSMRFRWDRTTSEFRECYRAVTTT